MTPQLQYRAFLATLWTVMGVLAIVALLAYFGKYAEALGASGVMTGLIAIGTRLAGAQPAGNTQADTNMAAALDKLPPATPGAATDGPQAQP